MIKFFNIFKKNKKINNKINKTMENCNYEFVIDVFDKDLTDFGKIQLKPKGRQVVVAPSRQELINIYQACDQEIKIISERPLINNTNNSNLNQTEKQNTEIENSDICKKNSIKPIMPQVTYQTRPDISPYVENTLYPNTAPNKPKYYKIGDIEIKEYAGKIYQKQWIRLSSKESENLRIINTSSNKLVPMNGKHIEIKKWILIDNSVENDDNELILDKDTDD